MAIRPASCVLTSSNAQTNEREATLFNLIRAKDSKILELEHDIANLRNQLNVTTTNRLKDFSKSNQQLRKEKEDISNRMAMFEQENTQLLQEKSNLIGCLQAARAFVERMRDKELIYDQEVSELQNQLSGQATTIEELQMALEDALEQKENLEALIPNDSNTLSLKDRNIKFEKFRKQDCAFCTQIFTVAHEFPKATILRMLQDAMTESSPGSWQKPELVDASTTTDPTTPKMIACHHKHDAVHLTTSESTECSGDSQSPSPLSPPAIAAGPRSPPSIRFEEIEQTHEPKPTHELRPTHELKQSEVSQSPPAVCEDTEGWVGEGFELSADLVGALFDEYEILEAMNGIDENGDIKLSDSAGNSKRKGRTSYKRPSKRTRTVPKMIES